MSRFRNAWAAGYVALIGALLALGLPAFAQGEKTVRAVMHAEVKWVDPHWTTANITQQHAYMIYETLFALDSKGNPRPRWWIPSGSARTSSRTRSSCATGSSGMTASRSGPSTRSRRSSAGR